MAAPEHKAAQDIELNKEVEHLEQLQQQEQQNQASSTDWSSGFDVAEIALDVIDVAGDLVKGIDLNF
ncbi:hypothetical protein [Acinetobacter sp. BSP-28]|uniref:hypothetical protein n=1 Tax=Acinetobacter sp. BSP-28 TaxID=3344661 RepID=UPI00376FCA1E